jgi:hypothetical protein
MVQCSATIAIEMSAGSNCSQGNSLLRSTVLPNKGTQPQGSSRIAWDTNLLCTLIFIFGSLWSRDSQVSIAMAYRLDGPLMWEQCIGGAASAHKLDYFSCITYFIFHVSRIQ